MSRYAFDYLLEVADDEITTVSPEEWQVDRRMMGNIVGGTIAGRFQNEGLRLGTGDLEQELDLESAIRCAVLASLERHTHCPPVDSLLCSEPLIRYLREPPFNSPESVLCN